MTKPRRPLPALTGVRFFLALWVVVYHQISFLAGDLGSSPVFNAIRPLLATGYAAVTAFFVLSGFVLAYNYDCEHLAVNALAWRRFAIARFARIYPAYLFGLLLLVPLALYRLWAGIRIAPLGVEWGNFALSIVLAQSWLPKSALSWNYPGWSLSNEAFFYACFPLIGAALWRLTGKPASLWAAMAVLWGLACTAPLAAMAIPLPGWGDAAATDLTLAAGLSPWTFVVRYNPLVRLPEFCLGILLAKLYSARNTAAGWGVWLYLPAGIAIILILSQADLILYPIVHNGGLAPLFGVMIFGLALGGGLPAQWLSSRPMLLLGNASYAMYILHAPIQMWLMVFSRRVLHQEHIGLAWVLVYVAVVITVSCVFYHFAEEPMHRQLRQSLERRRFMAAPAIQPTGR
jgi:peptidoglycan/LPS O-acetylase OafA/YrhL